MKNFIRMLMLGLLGVLVVGCSSGVKRDNGAAPAAEAVIKPGSVSTLVLAYSSEGKQEALENGKFDGTALLDHVERAMAIQGYLDKSAKEGLRIVVEVKGVRVRSSFSAVMFGVMAGADSITGDIVVQDSQGQEIDRYEVGASYALGGFAGGMDDARLGWLYENFAEEAVKEMGGSAKKS